MSTSQPMDSDAAALMDWVVRLHEAMAAKQAIYEAENDPHKKRRIARAILAEITSFLLELSVFKDDSAHFPLKELIFALSDLDRGRAPALLAPSNSGGTNITDHAKSELKFWVRAVFNVLIQNGFKKKEAYERIANGLTKSGRSFRNGNSIRWRNVQSWCREDETQPYAAMRERVEQWWSDFYNQIAGIKVVDGSGKPVSKKEIAGAFADQCWELPNIRDRSFP